MHPPFNQPGLFENSQVMGNSGRRNREGRGDLSDGFVALIDQPFDNAAPDGIGQSRQDRAQVGHAISL